MSWMNFKYAPFLQTFLPKSISAGTETLLHTFNYERASYGTSSVAFAWHDDKVMNAAPLPVSALQHV